MAGISRLARVGAVIMLAAPLMAPRLAAAGTPSTVTVGVGGASGSPSASYDGPALTGTDDPAGPSAGTCLAGACDREALTINIPTGYTTGHIVGVKVTVTSADGGGLDVSLLDSNGTLVASNSGGTSPNSIGIGDVQPGNYTIQVDGDIATGGTFKGVVATSVATRSILAALPGGGISPSRETIADPFRLGTEPNLAISPYGTVYESPIFGFSTTQSFLQRSDDNGQTFRPLGAPGTGKLVATPEPVCAGGGDSDIATSPNNDVYFIDLGGAPQVPAYVSNDGGLTFTSKCGANDENGANNFPDRQWLATDTVHNLEWYIYRDGVLNAAAPSPTDSFSGNLYGEFIKHAPLSSAPGTAGAAQLNFTSVCTDPAGLDTACVLDVQTAGNAITDNFGPKKGNTYVAEKAAGGVGVMIINPSSTPPVKEAIAAPTAINILFPTVAVDRAGNVYLAWADATTFAIKFSHSSDQGKTWSKPVAINGAPAAVNVMPWIVAGDSGRVDVVFYGSPATQAPTTNYGPWNIYMAQSLNATDPIPTWSQARMTDRPNHVDPVCLSGLGCTLATGPAGDRELGDFFRVLIDASGRAMISFADGNNQLGNEVVNGPLAAPSFAHFVRQATGPSLFASQVDVPPIPVPTNSVTVGAHHNPVPYDLPPAGVQGADNDALNLTGSSISYLDNNITVRMSIKNLDAIAAVTPPAMPTATYLTRWWYKGQVYYGAAEDTGGQWTYFSGQAAPITDGLAIKYAYYPSSGTATGKVVPGPNGEIDLSIPTDQVGGPPKNSPLFSVTSYALTHPSPTVPSPPTLTTLTDFPQVADVLPAYNFAVLGAGQPGSGPTPTDAAAPVAPSSTGLPSTTSVPVPAWRLGLIGGVAGALLVVAAVVLAEVRRRVRPSR